MNYYLLAALIFTAVGGIFSLVKQFQMLQQNSYFPSRYYGWLRDNLPIVNIAVFFLISSVLFSFRLFYFNTVLSAVYLVYSVLQAVNVQTKSIKKLVLTSRVKRLFAAAIILEIILILLYSVLGVGIIAALSCSLVFFLSFVSPALCFVSWAITLPLEKAFSKRYVNDAKRIIAEHKNLKVIGVTGSYGKTTTKFILTRILSEKYNTVCTPQSYNTPMGVVRTVRESLKPQTQIFVCEMGAKNIGDIKEICDIVNPDMGIITAVGPQHLDTFKSVDNVFGTKFELADSVFSKGGLCFVNGDSKELISRIDKNDFLIYGTDESFNCCAKEISYGKGGSSFTVDLGTEQIRLTSPLLGLHSIINITGAAAIAHSLGLSADEIRYAVASLKPTEHRLEMKPSVANSVMIDDAYNSNPEGSLEAVRVLGSFDGMKKVLITPGLVELGEKEYEYNYALGLEAAKYCDIIIFVGLNRSKPLCDAVNSTDFDKSKMFIAHNFFEGMDIYTKFADANTVLLVENDLPDNYLN